MTCEGVESLNDRYDTYTLERLSREIAALAILWGLDTVGTKSRNRNVAQKG
jgi:hypothetical protein